MGRATSGRQPGRLGRLLGALLVPALTVGGLVVLAGPAAAEQTTTQDLLGRLTVAPEGTSPYDRAAFEHWIDADGDGCDTRAEVLKIESLDPPTVGPGCTVTAGRWLSAYDGVTLTDPTRLDIDHVVALAEAWRSGASAWTAGQRRDYANDLTYDRTLAAVTDTVNASKGDSDASQWLPPDPRDDCQFATDQALVKYRWDLTVDQVEHDALANILTGPCGATAITIPAKGLTSPPPPAPGPTDRLTAGQQLAAGDQLATGAYRLVMQSDGNAVLYGSAGALWNSYTFIPGSRLVMQGDGNLVLYTPAGQPVFNTGTNGNPGAQAVLQGDGNLVVYRADGSPPWHRFADVAPRSLVGPPAPPAPTTRDTLTGGDSLNPDQQLTAGGYRTIMQGDGNLVVYGPSGALWNSRTSSAGSHLVMQGDGNAVVYTPSGSPAWNSGTAGNNGARLVMQTDGNLVVYRTNNTAAWNSFADRAPAPTAPTPPAAGPPAPPGAPPYPGDVKNCSDFATHASAQQYFEYYRQYYGDVAHLDADGDGLACESLP